VRRVVVLLGVIAALLVTAPGASAKSSMPVLDWLQLSLDCLKRPGGFVSATSEQRNAFIIAFRDALFLLYDPSKDGVTNEFALRPVEEVLVASFWYLFNRDIEMASGMQVASGQPYPVTSGGTAATSPSLSAFDTLAARVAALEQKPATTTLSTTSTPTTSAGTSASPSLAAFSALQARVGTLEQRLTATGTSTGSTWPSNLVSWTNDVAGNINSLNSRVSHLESTVGSIPSQHDLSYRVDELVRVVGDLQRAVQQLQWQIDH